MGKISYDVREMKDSKCVTAINLLVKYLPDIKFKPIKNKKRKICVKNIKQFVALEFIEQDEILRQFFKLLNDDKKYFHTTLHGYGCAIQRYMRYIYKKIYLNQTLGKRKKNPVRNFSLLGDSIFSAVKEELNKQMQTSCKNMVQSSALTYENLTPFHLSAMLEILCNTCPTDILNATFIMVGVTCCVRGGQSLRECTMCNFKLEFENGKIREIRFKKYYSKANKSGIGDLKKETMKF